MSSISALWHPTHYVTIKVGDPKLKCVESQHSIIYHTLLVIFSLLIL